MLPKRKTSKDAFFAMGALSPWESIHYKESVFFSLPCGSRNTIPYRRAAVNAKMRRLHKHRRRTRLSTNPRGVGGRILKEQLIQYQRNQHSAINMSDAGLLMRFNKPDAPERCVSLRPPEMAEGCFSFAQQIGFFRFNISSLLNALILCKKVMCLYQYMFETIKLQSSHS